jgi:Uncharacterized conserved protein, contains double-stranded beta-helix domain
MIITRFDKTKEIPTSEGIVRPLFVSDDLKVVFMKFPAGLNVPAHPHPYPDNFLLLKGSVVLHAQDPEQLGEGDLAHIPSGTAFGIECTKDAEALMISSPAGTRPSPGIHAGPQVIVP